MSKNRVFEYMGRNTYQGQVEGHLFKLEKIDANTYNLFAYQMSGGKAAKGRPNFVDVVKSQTAAIGVAKHYVSQG